MIKALFWDNDGVLVDTEHLYFLATREVLAGTGISLTRAQYIDLFLVQGKGAWHLAAERGLSDEACTRLREDRNTLYASFLRDQALVIDGVRPVVEALHRSYTMGIVTSSREDHFALIHEKSGLLPYFDFVLTASDYTQTKPHPEPYLRAVERSGVHPDECLVIEDSARGLAAATSAGIRCIVVPTALTGGSRFEGAYGVLGSLSELPALLERDLARGRTGTS